jgi:ADP-L-glycero-D-manno-heptose 6-epimerase
MASLVSKAVPEIQTRGRVSLFKSNDPEFDDGGQMRDFIYVKDVCAVLQTLLQRTDVTGILNLGTGTARTWNDLMRAVFTALEREPVIDYVEMPEHLSKQYQNYTQAEMDRFHQLLPGVLFSSLEESVADYVQGYLVREWPYC